MALHLTNHLFVLIGSISSICPVISNSILKTVKRRLCPLSTTFPHAAECDGQGHNEMSTATAWRKLGMCLNHQFFRIFLGSSYDTGPQTMQCYKGNPQKLPLDSYGLIPQKNLVLFTDPCEMVRRNLLFFWEIGWKHREKWHEMTLKAMPLMTTTFTGRGFFQNITGHGTLGLCCFSYAKSTPVLMGTKNCRKHHDIPH